VGGVLILLYIAAACVLFAGAGLVDLVLLPFRPLMPTTYYVEKLAVRATRLDGRTPVRVGHYLIQPPAPGDWRRITALEGAAQSPVMDVAAAPYRGARELFVRDPTARRPSAVRKLADSPIMFPPEEHVPGAPPPGRVDPAAFVRVDRLEPAEGDVRDRLGGFVEETRAGPDPRIRLSASPGLYQVARSEQASLRIEGLQCVRDEFVYLWLDTPARRGSVSRHLALTLACADPACPGQVVMLAVRGKADSGGNLERQGRSFLESFRVDPAAAPVCAAR
jgi:hypothetical protein